MADKRTDLKEVWPRVVAQSWSDAEYKSRVLNDPRQVLTEAGVNVPDDIELSVSDGGQSKVYLVIPEMPEQTDAQIDDESLESLSGGARGICCCLW